MNIPLTRRQLLAVLKPVWDYLKYWEPKQMGGDAEILGVSKAFFFWFSFESKKLWICSAPGQAVCTICFSFFPLDTNRLTWNLEDGSQSVLHGTAVTGRSGVGAGREVEMCQECSPAGFGVSSALLVKSWQICTFPSRDCTSPAWSFLELVLMSCWELRKWVGAGGLPVLLNWACRMEG